MISSSISKTTSLWRSEEGFTLLESIITAAILTILMYATFSVILYQHQSIKRIDLAQYSDLEKNLIHNRISQTAGLAFEGHIWINSDVTTALGVSWLNRTSPSSFPTPGDGAGFVLRNAVLTGMQATSVTSDDVLTMSSTSHPSWDVLVIIARSRDLPEFSVRALDPTVSLSGTEDHVFPSTPAGTSIDGKSIQMTTAADRTIEINESASELSEGDVLAVESGMGYQFIKVRAAVGSQIEFDTLGQYDTGSIVTDLPSRYLEPETKIYAAEAFVMGYHTETENFAIYRSLKRNRSEVVEQVDHQFSRFKFNYMNAAYPHPSLDSTETHWHYMPAFGYLKVEYQVEVKQVYGSSTESNPVEPRKIQGELPL